MVVVVVVDVVVVEITWAVVEILGLMIIRRLVRRGLVRVRGCWCAVVWVVVRMAFLRRGIVVGIGIIIIIIIIIVVIVIEFIAFLLLVALVDFPCFSC